VNAYLREISGQDFSAKDFRTWAGTVLCAAALRELGACASASEAQRNVAHVVMSVAQQLGNTPAVCRSSYIHPSVIEEYFESHDRAPRAKARGQKRETTGPRSSIDLGDDEAAVMRLLRRQLEP
jgi:DNA topoisomerase-1